MTRASNLPLRVAGRLHMSTIWRQGSNMVPKRRPTRPAVRIKQRTDVCEDQLLFDELWH